MRIGILTFHYVANYGAVLQAFALKRTLENFGHEAVVIDYRPQSKVIMWNALEYRKSIRDSIRYDRRGGIIRSCCRYFYVIGCYLKFILVKYRFIKKKYAKFEKFVYKFLCHINAQVTTVREFEQFNNYDMIIYGSDQIWNPEITGGLDPMYFGGYTKKEQLKVAYAASIGSLTILNDDNIKNNFLFLLNQLDYLSVRECNLYKYLSSAGIKVMHVADPTLLLKSDEYSTCKMPDKKQCEYVLVYHLLYDKRMNALARKIARINGWKVVIINGTFSGGLDVRKDTGPEEFVTLLANASYVITNSFHGTTLSLVFNKNFYVLLPSVRQDRIKNLLDDFKLQSRVVDVSVNELSIENIDYMQVNKIMTTFRQRSLHYLTSIIAENNES